jgi:hydrogenase maturation protein HypF
LEQASAFADFRKNLGLYRALFGHQAAAVAIDSHPDYFSSKLGRGMGLPVIEVQHHHAHTASCLAENGWPLSGDKVLGVALDGLGLGADGTIWGGEFLLADYRVASRLAHFKAVAMPGGAAAIREPWRNLHAHLCAVHMEGSQLPALCGKPLATLSAMMARGVNAPLASSCGRLFDAVAAALGLCDGQQAYEGDAAARLETLAEHAHGGDGYDFAFVGDILEPAPMWEALLADLADGVPREAVGARFHAGLARALARTATLLAKDAPFDTVALSGGCFQNRLLFEQTQRRLQDVGFTVLTHAKVPANDGGLALGQAAIAAAHLLQGISPCA